MSKHKKKGDAHASALISDFHGALMRPPAGDSFLLVRIQLLALSKQGEQPYAHHDAAEKRYSHGHAITAHKNAGNKKSRPSRIQRMQ